MADFPDDVFALRDIENKPNMTYDPDKKTTLFVEDLQALGNEITAIEEFLENDVINGWQDWTPQVDQGATTNITKTITYARYKIIGDSYQAQCILSVTGTGTTNNNITISLPFTTFEDNQFCGFFAMYSASLGKLYVGGAVSTGSGTKIVGARDNSQGGFYMGKDPNVALGNYDVLTFNIFGKIA